MCWIRIVAETGADAVFWNRRYGGGEIEIDTNIKKHLSDRGIRVESFNAHLLNEPWTVMRGEDAPYRVFTPYWKAARAVGTPSAPLGAPARSPAGEYRTVTVSGEALADWSMLPVKPNWATGFDGRWLPGESGATARLEEFLDALIEGYAEDRNRPDLTSTSRLSPHLRFGEISPRTIWHATQHRLDAGHLKPRDAKSS